MIYNKTVKLGFMPMSPTTCLLCLKLRNCMNSNVHVLNKQLVATDKIINLVAIGGHTLTEPTIKCLYWCISFYYWNVPIIEEKWNYVLPSMYIDHIKIILKMTMEISVQMKLY
jgi:hypothetical protein